VTTTPIFTFLLQTVVVVCVARIEPLTVALFLPLFFAFTGLRTDICLLLSPWLAVETAIILAPPCWAKPPDRS
jgi:Kef-type K+ transport system membrane component KefB